MSNSPNLKFTEFGFEFENHRLPITVLRKHREELSELIRTAFGPSVDTGERLDALIWQFPGGRLITYETGTVTLRLQHVPVREGKQLMLACIKKLCDFFSWDVTTELFAVQIDLQTDIATTEGTDVTKKLVKLCKLAVLRQLCGLSKNPNAVGYSLFLSRLGDPDKDTRLRVAPLHLDPHGRYHLHLSDFTRRLRLADLGNHIDQADKIMRKVSKSVGGKQ